jgi:gliding motility-associated-like protein
LVSVIGYPLFFTPNGDGKNDAWQILGVSAAFQPLSLIYIFDRHGRLMAQIPADGIGWDGTYNGSALPADDYWFRVKLQDGRSFTGHFSLVR